MEQDARGWPLRVWTLAAAGAVIGWIAHALSLRFGIGPSVPTPEPLRLALAVLLVVAGIVFGVTWERRRQGHALAFAVLAGLVVAGVVAWNGGPGGWAGGNGWRLLCAVAAVWIATPFFQVARDGWSPAVPRRFAYPALHAAAWTNTVLLLAALLFVLAAWLLAWLIAGLFNLLAIRLLVVLLGRGDVGLALTGGALGAGIGLLRDRDAVLAALQRVAVSIFAVLAPVAAAGFALFLLSLPVTGLGPLWQATKSTTPILLGCAIAALVLANAVIADAPEDEARSPVLRWAARLLGLSVLPFAAIAAVSVAVRIGEHGLSPGRLWATAFVAIVSAYGLAYLVALVRGWRGSTWPAHIRAANLRLAMGVCAVALVLSTPLAGFAALSTRDQVARLRQHRVTPAAFDWAALRFSFGPSGVAAVRTLASDPDPAIRAAAREALAARDKWAVRAPGVAPAAPLRPRLRVPPGAPPLPDALVAAVDAAGTCGGEARCLVRVDPSGASAVVVYEGSDPPNPGWAYSARAIAISRSDTGWDHFDGVSAFAGASDADRRAWHAAFDRGDLKLVPVVRHQIEVGGRPIGSPIP